MLGTCLACTPERLANVDYVDPFIGTGFHGHTYPGATVPHGAVQLSPDTRAGNWDACAGYHYSDPTLKGFSHTHLSGTGCIDLGDLLFRPTTRQVDFGADSLYRVAAFSHQDEKAEAGYYAVTLADEKIKAELTATTHTGVHRYTFPSDSEARIIVDWTHLLDNEHIYEASLNQTAENELTGMRCTRGWTDNQYVYFAAQFSKPFTTVETGAEGKIAVLSFDNSDGQPVVAKVGISTVSVDNARQNSPVRHPGGRRNGSRADQLLYGPVSFVGRAQYGERCQRAVSPAQHGNRTIACRANALFHLLSVGHLPRLEPADDPDRYHAGERHGQFLLRYL